MAVPRRALLQVFLLWGLLVEGLPAHTQYSATEEPERYCQSKCGKGLRYHDPDTALKQPQPDCQSMCGKGLPYHNPDTALKRRQPDCQSKCGDFVAPYPFGFSENCSLPGFTLSCSNRSISYETMGQNETMSQNILSVSLEQAQARILITPSRFCLTTTSTVVGFKLQDKPFRFSTTDNKLVVIGCNTLGLIQGNDKENLTVGCFSMCGRTHAADTTAETSDSPVQASGPVAMNGRCSGIGCCQAVIPSGLWGYSISTRRVSIVVNEIHRSDPSITFDTSDKGECGYAFIVEKSNYSFNISDIKRPETDKWVLQAVLDWAIGKENCSEAEKNALTYACKSNNSRCLTSKTGFGYICNCTSGYQGNPYLVNGCEDIDECRDPGNNPCYYKGELAYGSTSPTCVNYPGSYICTCPEGLTKYDGFCASANTAKNKSNKTVLEIAVATSCGLATLLLLVSIGFIRKSLKKKRLDTIRKHNFKENHDLLIKRQPLCSKNDNITNRVRFISIQELEKATNKFDVSRIVGSGGHGTVYKGILDLEVVAIKKSNVDDQNETEQFINEIILLSQIIHRNVVKLIGCCLETVVPMLVYEFVPNGTLFQHLHSAHKETPLPWNDRLRIATEICSALAHMHSTANVSIFHRDVKSPNILLDDKLTAKLSDFGASKPINFGQSHITTKVEGTLAYMDPQYMQTGQLNEKTDVYSLGVILVELLTGTIPTSYTINRFISSFSEGKISRVLDPCIEEDSRKEAEIIAKLAMASLSLAGEDRPTMKEVEVTLEGLMNEKKKKQTKVQK